MNKICVAAKGRNWLVDRGARDPSGCEPGAGAVAADHKAGLPRGSASPRVKLPRIPDIQETKTKGRRAGVEPRDARRLENGRGPPNPFPGAVSLSTHDLGIWGTQHFAQTEVQPSFCKGDGQTPSGRAI